MQSKNKNDGVQFPTRYWAYDFAKRHLGGFGGRKVFPIGESERGDLSEYEERKRICSNTLKARDYKGGGNLIKETQKLSDAMRVRNIDGVSSTLKGLGGGMGAKTGLYAISKTVRAGGRGSPKGSRQEWDIVGGIRRLTPTECERLQGFLDGWTEGVSDTQRYRQLGNAVTTTVITEIGKKLISCCQ